MKCHYMEISEATNTVYVCRKPKDGHLVHTLTYGWNPND